MSTPSSRTTRSPGSKRQAPSLRSIVGRAAGGAASTGDTTQERSVERPAEPGLCETTCGDPDRVRDLATLGSDLDHRGPRWGTRNSTGGAARARGVATRSTTPPDRDRFLASVGALRDWLTYIGQNATWRVALASVFGCVSTQVPLPNENTFARALLFISAVTIGALVGKRLDRKERRKP